MCKKNKFIQYQKIFYLFIFGLIAKDILAKMNANSLLLNLADSLYCQEMYDEAITEYKRLVFFHQEYNDLSDIYSLIGKCYQKTGQFNKSINYFLKSIELAGDDSLKNENRISLAVSGIAAKNYNLAIVELQKVILFCHKKN